MNSRRSWWPLLAVMVVVGGAAIAALWWFRTQPAGPVAQLKRMPQRDAIVLYVDFAALRQGGIFDLLAGSKAAEDAEYRAFADRIHFDYRQDLDSAMVAFAPTGKYMLVKGRFDWPKLQAYAKDQGGECIVSTCRMKGSAPDRQISFLPLQKSLMALAVSPDDSAVRRLEATDTGPDPELPQGPIWLTIPNSALRSGDALPSGTRMFAHSMEAADSVTLSFVPDGQRLAARLDVRCRGEQDATQIAADLTRVTGMLKTWIEKEKQTPNPADLSGVLTSGTFRAEGKRVAGYWLIERSFVTNVLSGGM